MFKSKILGTFNDLLCALSKYMILQAQKEKNSNTHLR